MKKLAVILSLSLFSFGTSFSQESEEVKKSPEEHAANRSERLGKALKLTETQQKELYAISQKHFEDTKSKREQLKTLRDELKAAKKDYESQIEALLDEKQKVKYAEIKEKRKEKHKQKRHNHDVAPPTKE